MGENQTSIQSNSKILWCGVKIEPCAIQTDEKLEGGTLSRMSWVDSVLGATGGRSDWGWLSPSLGLQSPWKTLVCWTKSKGVLGAFAYKHVSCMDIKTRLLGKTIVESPLSAWPTDVSRMKDQFWMSTLRSLRSDGAFSSLKSLASVPNWVIRSMKTTPSSHSSGSLLQCHCRGVLPCL